MAISSDIILLKHYLKKVLCQLEKQDRMISRWSLEYEANKFSFCCIDTSSAFQAPPPNFSNNLLRWTKNTFELENNEVEKIIHSYGRVCIPSKGCYDPDGIGEHCCIF